MPRTIAKKFGYAYDWAIATRHSDIDVTVDTLNEERNTLGKYFRKCILQPRVAKTETACSALLGKLRSLHGGNFNISEAWPKKWKVSA